MDKHNLTRWGIALAIVAGVAFLYMLLRGGTRVPINTIQAGTQGSGVNPNYQPLAGSTFNVAAAVPAPSPQIQQIPRSAQNPPPYLSYNLAPVSTGATAPKSSDPDCCCGDPPNPAARYPDGRGQTLALNSYQQIANTSPAVWGNMYRNLVTSGMLDSPSIQGT